MEAVGKLAGGIAHDFNNMLTAIIGYSEILMIDDRMSEKQRGYVEEIRRSATRATSLTQQLLAFSRKQVLQPKTISINALVVDIHTLLKRLIGEHIQLDLILDNNLGLAKVDPGPIEQVIVNLALNARDSMPDGGTLRIETKNVCLSQGIRDYMTPGDYVVLSMSDTGSGMDKETMRHIYEPFFTTKEKGKGTGLGLSTVYGIVKQSSGFIEVESTLNKGTTFEIYIPRDLTLEKEEEKKPSGTTHLNGHETILLVEDDDFVRNLLDTCLRQYGYEVLSAANGKNALQICEQGREDRFDLLITDVVMPDMNGRALAKRILDKWPSTKALYMSGYTDDAIIHHDVLDEGLYFIQKPFTPHDLARKVREILDSQ
jgi:CheY-like chemotaxis protein